MIGAEEAAQGGQPQRGRAACKSVECDLKALPQIAVIVIVATPFGAFTQTGKGIAFGVDLSLFCGRFRGMKQISFFRGEEEDESIDQPEELLEVLFT